MRCMEERKCHSGRAQEKNEGERSRGKRWEANLSSIPGGSVPKVSRDRTTLFHHLSTNMRQDQESVGESSSSSALSSQQDIEDDRIIATVLSEEYSKLDGAIGRRLSHLNSIPHTPRINGAIPSTNEATLDHQRLLDRLTMYGLSELKIEGDGNCQFRALSDQLYHNPEYHKHVRKEVVKQLKSFRSAYEGYVPMNYKDYLKRMKKSGEWGDHVTLQSAADRFGAKICLLTSFRDTCFIEILPKQVTLGRDLWLSFWCEVHYNSLYEVGEVPIRVPKKKHWLF